MNWRFHIPGIDKKPVKTAIFSFGSNFAFYNLKKGRDYG
jgi:hypothetical protein